MRSIGLCVLMLAIAPNAVAQAVHYVKYFDVSDTIETLKNAAR